MYLVEELLALVAVASLGIFFGAMLTEGLVLVPYWRSIPAEAFYSWYGANDKRLLGFFGPLTWLAALSALAAAGTSLWITTPGAGMRWRLPRVRSWSSRCSSSILSGQTPPFR